MYELVCGVAFALSLTMGAGWNGSVAQLVELFLYTERVAGSSPAGTTLVTIIAHYPSGQGSRLQNGYRGFDSRMCVSSPQCRVGVIGHAYKILNLEERVRVPYTVPLFNAVVVQLVGTTAL